MNKKREFCNDIFLPDMLYGALVRSPKPSGTVKSVTLPEMDKEYVYFCAKDIKGKKTININQTEVSIFAETKVEYTGEPIGIIVGPDESTAIKLRDLVAVEIEETPPLKFSPSAENPHIIQRTVSFGDYDTQAKNCTIMENSFFLPQMNSLHETAAVIVDCKENTQNIEIYASSISSLTKTITAEVLECKKEHLLLHKTTTNKISLNDTLISSLLAARTAVCAHILKKPVKITLSRYEQSMFWDALGAQIVQYKTAVSKDGSFVGMDISVFIDAGIYNPYIQIVLDRLIIAACGIYQPKNVRISAYALKTNKAPTNFILQYCDAPIFFAAESQVQQLVERLTVSPIEIRKKNIQCKGGFFCMHENMHVEEVIDSVVKDSDFNRKYTAYNLFQNRKVNIQNRTVPLRGIGIAAAFNGSSFFNTVELKNYFTVELTLNEESELHIHMHEPIPSVKKTIIALIKDILSIGANQVHFQWEHTGKTLEFTELLTINSGVTIQLIKTICYEIAALKNEKKLPISIKKKFKPPENIIWDAQTLTGTPYITASWGAAAAEIEIDTITYEAVLRGIWITVDAGSILNEKSGAALLRSNIDSVIDLLGLKRTENLPIKIRFLKSQENFKEFEGIADNVVPAAIFASLSQAIGKNVQTVPITSQLLFDAFTNTEGT